MKKYHLFVYLFLWTSFLINAQTYPFPQHISYTGTHIKPDQYTQKQMDKFVTDFYDLWKSVYLKSSCGGGFQYFVSFDDGKTCVSEGQGYGMMIIPLMAGYEANAQTYFNGLYKYYKAHPSSINENLMAWKQVSCVDEDGADAASDGDIDIAYGLLLAHVQWGSSGEINYLQEAKNIINAIMKDEINQSTWTVKLGDWSSSGDKYYYSTRTSDFILDHFRVFSCAANNDNWNNVVDTCYSLIVQMQENYSPQTGLLPDFIVDVNTSAKPAPADFLEGENDGDYYYNACRDPWRLTTDYLLFGDERAKTAVNKINTWLMNKCGNDVNKIKSGYKLDGAEIATWDDPAFVGPFTVGAMLGDNQQWLNDIFDKLIDAKFADNDYYSNTIKLLNLIVLSGNYWSPACDELITGIRDIKQRNQPKLTYWLQNRILQIEFKQDGLPDMMSIMDINGKVIYQKSILMSIEKINLSDVPPGIYIIGVKKNNFSQYEKFIIE